MKKWEIEINTSKFKNKSRTSDLWFIDKQFKKIKKLYEADEIYREENDIIVYYKKRIGVINGKRLDGVIV